MFQEREWGCSGRMRYFKTGSSALGEPHASARLALAVHSARAVPGGAVGKESTCNEGDARDTGSIPGLGRSPGRGQATHSSILAWKIPRTEDPGG